MGSNYSVLLLLVVKQEGNKIISCRGEKKRRKTFVVKLKVKF